MVIMAAPKQKAVQNIKYKSRSASPTKQSKDKSFWSLLQLDHSSLDQELDDAAVRAYERLRYSRQRRSSSQIDPTETNKNLTIVTEDRGRKSRSRSKKSSNDRKQKSNDGDRNGDTYKRVESQKVDKRSKMSTVSGQKDVKDPTVRTEKRVLPKSEAPLAATSKDKQHLQKMLPNNKQGKVSSDQNKSNGNANIKDLQNGTSLKQSVGQNQAKILKEVSSNKPKDVTESQINENSQPTGNKSQKSGPSTLPSKAKVQFLWAKTVPTKTTCVRLKVDKIKELIPLHYVAPKDIYLSAELTIPCDTYTCWLIVDTIRHKTESVIVKHYTFEVDLYIEEEEEAPSDGPPSLTTQRQQSEAFTSQPTTHPQSTSQADLRRTTSTKTTAKRPERAGNETASNQGADPHSESKSVFRRKKDLVPPNNNLKSELQEVERFRKKKDMEDVMEGDDSPGIRHSNRLENLLRQQMNKKKLSRNGVPDPDARGLNGGQYPGSMDMLNQDFRDDFKPASSRSDFKGRIGSKQSIDSSEQELSQYLDGPDARYSTDRGFSSLTYSGGSRQSNVSRSRSMDVLNTVEGQYNSHRSGDSTPTPADTKKYSYPDHQQETKHRQETESSKQYRSERYNGIRASTPPRDHKPPSDFKYDRQFDNHSSSLRNSHNSQSDSLNYRGDKKYDSSHGSSDRTHYQKSELSHPTDRFSSQVPSGREDRDRMQDLEEAVKSLRKAVADREREIQEVRSERNRFSEEVSHLKQIYEKPTEGRDENEKRINQLIQEKENLATEVWKFKRDIDELKNKQQEKNQSPAEQEKPSPSKEGDNSEENHLRGYNPNNPQVLQRKLEDLESQIQDLNEAHEATVHKLAGSEKDVAALKEENRALRMESSRRIERDMEEENRRLRQQLEDFQKEDGDYLKQELSHLRHELGSLKDRNHQLMEDNIKLTEHLKELDTGGRKDRFSTNRRPDPLVDRHNTRSWSPAAPAKDEDDEFSRSRQRLTQELKQIVTPPKWSHRDYYNHGDEGPQIRKANYDPFTRARSVSPTRQARDRPETVPDRIEPRHSTRFHENRPDKYETKHQQESDRFKERYSDRYDDTCRREIPEKSLERLHDSSRDRLNERSVDRHDGRLDNREFDLDSRERSRLPEKGLVNGYHRPVSPPVVRSERRLSGNSDTTVDLMDASPLGEYKLLNNHSPDEEFQQGIQEEYQNSSHGVKFSSVVREIPSELLRPKRRDPIDDVMDDLPLPPSTRCHLKVDLVTDILDEDTNIINTINHQRPHIAESKPSNSNYLDHKVNGDASSGFSHQMAALPHSSRHNMSNQSSVLDDLLDTSVDDPGYLSYNVLHRPNRDSRPRRDSLDSNSTEVILGIAAEEIIYSNKPNEVSSDRFSNPQGTPPRSLRSVSPKPVITQHNKHLLGSNLSNKESQSYANKRPFAPRTPADVNIGDIVKFCRHGGKISKGQVKYVGHLPGKNDSYLGLELEHEMGKHDGVYEEVRYFQCKPNRGVFVAFSKVVMAWGD